MAYALVAWTGDGDAVEAAMTAIPAIHFFRGLFLIQEDGVSWKEITDKVRAVVEANPGTQAVIVTPSKGTRVGGWVHDAPVLSDLEEARKIMNRSGSTAVPVFWATPPVVDEDD